MNRSKSLLTGIILAGLLPLGITTQAASPLPSPQGHMAVEQLRALRTIPTAIEVYGPINLDLSQGEGAQLSIWAEESLQSKIATKFDGESLRVELDDEVEPPHAQITLKLVLPELKKIVVRGSGTARVVGFLGNRVEISRYGSGDLEFIGQYANVSAGAYGSGRLDLRAGRSESMEIRSSGSGKVTATGAVANLYASLRGSGQLAASALVASTVRLSTRGSSLARVRAEKELNLDMRGPGRVIVAGNPTARNESSRGDARVTWD